jgi:hypothetical protein
MSHELARVPALLSLLLVAGLATRPAQADPGDCPGVAAAGYKVLLDQIVGATASSASPADVQLFRERVHQAVDTKIKKLALEQDSAIQLVGCDQRSPANPTEISKQVDALDTRDVLLEIWGVTGADIDDAGHNIRTVRLDFALIPACEKVIPTCVPFFPFLTQPTTLASPAAGVLALFRRADDVATYSLIGLGVKWQRAGNDLRALRYLCQADAALARGASNDDRNALRSFVQRTVKAIVTKARTNPASVVSLLDDPQASPCGATP